MVLILIWFSVAASVALLVWLLVKRQQKCSPIVLYICSLDWKFDKAESLKGSYTIGSYYQACDEERVYVISLKMETDKANDWSRPEWHIELSIRSGKGCLSLINDLKREDERALYRKARQLEKSLGRLPATIGEAFMGEFR